MAKRNCPHKISRFVGFRPLSRGPLVEARGFTVVEIMIATGVFLILMYGIYNIFESSRTTYAAGEAKVDIQQIARVAMERTATDLRLAGYGFPTGAGAITAATPTSISFWADLNNASTILTTNVNAGGTDLTVDNASGIQVRDVVYLINGGQTEQLTVSAVNLGTNTVSVATGATAGYPAGAQVTRPKLITYALDGSAIEKDDGEGGGSQPLTDDIQAFQLQYFDDTDTEILPGGLAANLGNIRRIRIAITVQSQDGGVATEVYTINSDVRVRNL